MLHDDFSTWSEFVELRHVLRPVTRIVHREYDTQIDGVVRGTPPCAMILYYMCGVRVRASRDSAAYPFFTR